MDSNSLPTTNTAQNAAQQQAGSMPAEKELPSPQGPSMPPTPANQSVVSGGKKRSFSKVFMLATVLLVIVLLVVVGITAFRFLSPNLLPGDQVELVWWGLWEDEAIVQPLIEEYQAANPNVTIIYRSESKENYRERLTNALARGDGPDIFRIHNSWVPMFQNDLSVAPPEVMSAQEFQTIFYPVMADDLVGPSGPVGIPLMYDGLAMFVNEEIFTTYAKAVPKTWNEARDIARDLTIRNELGVITQSGASLGNTVNVDHWPEIVALLMYQNQASLGNPSSTPIRSTEALQFYKQFEQVDQVWDATLPNSTIAFGAGRVAMYFGPSWRAFEIMEMRPNFRFRAYPVPQIPKDEDLPDITYATYWFEGVSAKSEAQEEAWKFLAFMSQRETLEKFYQNSAQVRQFGELYPRQDMRNLLLNDPITGGFMQLAPQAKSWYLASRTFDGATGINSSLFQYYADAINAIDARRAPRGELETLSAGARQVLSRYGLSLR